MTNVNPVGSPSPSTTDGGLTSGQIGGIFVGSLITEGIWKLLKSKGICLTVAELEGENLRRLQDKGVFEGTSLDPNRGLLIA